MKKLVCLALVVLTMLALFTGCSGRAYTNMGRGNRRHGERGMGGMYGGGNVSTSRDGTVNGGRENTLPDMMPNADMGAHMEIGK